MISFESDYNNGCHEAILKRLTETNDERATGYGLDDYCNAARDRVREACEMPDADVFFLVGGTQTNATVIDAVLRGYQGVLTVETGHINVHESGAIEFGGHKVLALPTHDGKMDAGELRQWLEAFYADRAYEHMVFPAWSISLLQPRWEPSTPVPNLKPSTTFADNISFRCSSTVHAWATA